MKYHSTKILTLTLSLAASFVLGSCVSDTPRVSSHQGSGGGKYVTYTKLPRNYSGDSYYSNNRHYAGGRYETGRYSYGGRSYNNRYYHNGQYLYGGTYRNHPTVRTFQTSSPRRHQYRR